MLTLSRFWFIELVIVLMLHWKQSFCQDIIHLNAPHGNITTPNYPNDYNKNSEIIWLITGRSGQRIRLEVKDLILRDCGSCICDSVEIYDGLFDEMPPRLTQLCSSITLPKVFYSSGNKIEVAFYIATATVGSRRMWLYYESFAVSPTTAPTLVSTTVPTTVPATSSKSGSTSDQSTVLVVLIVVAAVTVVCFIFTCGLRHRLSRRRSTPNQQNSTATQDQQTTIELADQPPSYDEAIISSQPSVHYPYRVTQELNVDHDQSTQEAYDSSGLPSYAEAHRLSQGSLNRL